MMIMDQMNKIYYLDPVMGQTGSTVAWKIRTGIPLRVPRCWWERYCSLFPPPTQPHLRGVKHYVLLLHKLLQAKDIVEGPSYCGVQLQGLPEGVEGAGQ